MSNSFKSSPDSQDDSQGHSQDHSQDQRRYPQHLACPQCGVLVATSIDTRPVSFPFCKQRCRVIDLGAWSDESNIIAGDDAFDEFGMWSDEL